MCGKKRKSTKGKVWFLQGADSSYTSEARKGFSSANCIGGIVLFVVYLSQCEREILSVTKSGVLL